jgi:predicted transcriptional regulator
MLAFRQAQIMNQQNTMDASQQGAILAEQERRQAEQMIAAQAAAARGVALQQSLANQQAQTAQRAQNMQLVSGIGGTAAKAVLGGKDD